MLYPVAVIVARMRPERGLVCVEDPVDGPVALGVDADLPAGRVGADDRVAEVLLGAPVERPGELAVRDRRAS